MAFASKDSTSQGMVFFMEVIGIVTFPGMDVGVGGIAVSVGKGVSVGIGVSVGKGVNVGRTGASVGAGAHPLKIKTVSKTSTRNFDPIIFFMTLSPFI